MTDTLKVVATFNGKTAVVASFGNEGEAAACRAKMRRLYVGHGVRFDLYWSPPLADTTWAEMKKALGR